VNATNALSEFVCGEIDYLIKAQGSGVFSLDMARSVDIACLAPRALANCVTALPTEPPMAGADVLPR